MKKLFYLIFLSFSLNTLQSSNNNHSIDSLKLLSKYAKHDTLKINALKTWDGLIYMTDPNLDFEINSKISELCYKNMNKKLDSKEIKFYLKNNAVSLNIIGINHYNNGNFAKGIESFTNSLKINESLNDKHGIAKALNNIGMIYHAQKDYEKANEYYFKSLSIHKENNNKSGIASSLNNIGSVYNDLLDYNKAIQYFEKSYDIHESMDNKANMISTLNNIGLIYSHQNKLDKAKELAEKALAFSKEINYQYGMINSLNNLGKFYSLEKNYSVASMYCSKALNLSKEIGSITNARISAEHLFKIYSDQNNYKSALEMHLLSIEFKDSLENEENQKEIIRQSLKYEYEKKATADSVKSAESNKLKDAMLLAQQAENKQQVLRSYFLYGGLGLTILFGLFIFNRFTVTNKQKQIIEKQKIQVDSTLSLLEEQNKKILDSINYAKRIQTAILPPIKIVNELLPDSFILYKPKDIVAGDFYWIEQKDNKVLFASADCTGHGVPGAMVSVICNNALNRSVNEFQLTEPGKILDKTRDIVIQEFEKSEEHVQDGMDIALCCLDGFQLKYAGANNPLWIIRNNECIIYSANKEPIGKFDHKKPYNTHIIDLQKGDTIYIFSDGFADQFGGKQGKKLKSKAFKEILLNIHKQPMSNQLNELNNIFVNWMGKYEQIDDVCVIGVKI